MPRSSSFRWTLGALLATAAAACASDDTQSDPAAETTDVGSSGQTSTGDDGSAGEAVGSDTSTTGTSTSDGTTDDPTGDASTTGPPVPPPDLDDCIDDATPGDHVYPCGDLTFDVMVPERCLDTACGLVVDVHGFTMSGRMEDNNTNMRALGDERGYIVLQPNANPAPPNSSWNPAVDDEKIIDFAQRVIETFHVDEDRVHITGFSQGGFMSWRMVCNHSDFFASAAPGAACEGELAIPDCTFTGGDVPEQPIPILYMHGTRDGLVAFDCAEPRRDAVVSHFGLETTEMVEQSEHHTWTRYTGPNGAHLEFIEHDYAAAAALLAGHCYPGASDPADIPGQLFPFHCEGESAFNWGEAVMDFFEAHPR